MTVVDWAIVAIVVVLVRGFSVVLALAETAFVRVSRIRLLALAEEGDKRAERRAAAARASRADAQQRAAARCSAAR